MLRHSCMRIVEQEDLAKWVRSKDSKKDKKESDKEKKDKEKMELDETLRGR